MDRFSESSQSDPDTSSQVSPHGESSEWSPSVESSKTSEEACGDSLTDTELQNLHDGVASLHFGEHANLKTGSASQSPTTERFQTRHHFPDEFLSLRSLCQLLGLNECSCSDCRSIDSSIKNFGPVCAWNYIFDDRRSKRCDVYSRIADMARSTLCEWAVCYKCLTEGSITSRPRLISTAHVVDVTSFDVLPEIDNTLGHCRIHGAFFIPKCLGDVPEVALLAGVTIQEPEVFFQPLRINWNREHLVAENSNKLVYIPNVFGFKRTVRYKVLHAYKSDNTYLIRRVTKLPRSVEPLHQVLQGRDVDHFIWTNFSFMIGTSNSGLTVSGERMFERKRSVQHPSSQSKRKSKSPETELSDSESDQDLWSGAKESSESSEEHQPLTALTKSEGVELLEDIMSLRADNQTPAERSISSETSQSSDDSETTADLDYVPPDLALSETNVATYVFQDVVQQAEVEEDRITSKRSRNGDSKKTQEQIRYDAQGDRDQDVVEADKDEGKECENVSEQRRNAMLNNYCTPFLTDGAISRFFHPESANTSTLESAIGPREALETLMLGNLEFVRSSIFDGEIVDFERTDVSLTRGKEFISLQMHIDLDSIDVVTCLLGGNAFNSAYADIFLVWQDDFFYESAACVRNNGLVGFRYAHSEFYPGNYFGNERYFMRRAASGGKRPRFINDPMHLAVFDVLLPFCHRPLKVYAMVPSKALICLVHGEGAVLELFGQKMGIVATRENGRFVLSRLVWYLISSLLLFFANLGTRDGLRCSAWSREICCCFPSSRSTYKCLHNAKDGHLSGYNRILHLSQGSLSIALCLFARHQRAIEQNAQLPEDLCSTSLSTQEMYKLQPHLESIVNPEMLPILKRDVGSQEVLTFFQNFWTQGKRVGNLLSLRSDTERRRGHALPNLYSNRRAFQRGELILEDLLCLSHVLFRGIVHGMKSAAYSKDAFENIIDSLKTSLNPHCFLDGRIDIGYVLNHQPELDFSVHFRRKALKSGRILFPASCKKSISDMGSYMTGAPGYPFFVGFSTANGNCGDPTSSVSPFGIRKVKVYSTKWENDSKGGRTIYDAKTVSRLLNQIRSPAQLLKLCHREGRETLDEHLSFTRTAYDHIFHNIQHRKDCFIGQTNMGLRVEYSYYFDSEFLFADLPANLLYVQERFAQDPNVFGEDGLQVPWWMKIRTGREGELPVCFIPGDCMKNWSFTIEKCLVELSCKVYKRGLSFLAGRESEVEAGLDFLIPILQNLSVDSGVRFVSLVAFGLLESARREVDSRVCHRKSGIPLRDEAEVMMCGLSASLWSSGIPVLVLSRICSHPLFRCGYTIRQRPEGKLETTEYRVSQTLRTSDDMRLPTRLRFQKAVLDLSKTMEATESIAGFISEDEAFMKLFGLIQPLFSIIRLENARNQQSPTCAAAVATLATRAIISDIGNSIEKAFGSRATLEGSIQTLYKKRYRSTITAEDFESLVEATSSNRMWSTTYRLDCALNHQGRPYPTCKTALRGLVELFPKNNVLAEVVVEGSSWKPHVLPIDSEEFVTDEHFILALWKAALQSSCEERSTASHWEVVILFRSVIRLFQSRGNAKYFPQFAGDLSRALSSAMRSAGFSTICPALRNNSHYADAESLFYPLLFAKMKFLNRRLTLPLSSSIQTVTVPHNGGLLSRISLLVKEFEQLQHFRRGARPHSPEWKELSEQYSNRSKEFWGLQGIDDLILRRLQDRFARVRQEKSLLEVDLRWVEAILKALISMRRTLGDEGIAATVDEERKLVCYRDTQESFKNGSILSRPWEGTEYPSSPAFFGKKTRVNKFSSIMGRDFPIFFKVLPGLTKGGKVIYGLSNTTMTYPECFRHLFVEDIHELFQDQDASTTSRMQWRLSPSRMIAETLVYLGD